MLYKLLKPVKFKEDNVVFEKDSIVFCIKSKSQFKLINRNRGCLKTVVKDKKYYLNKKYLKRLSLNEVFDYIKLNDIEWPSSKFFGKRNSDCTLVYQNTAEILMNIYRECGII